MAGERWIFTRAQLVNTPSRKCGIDSDKELNYRQQTANFIQDMGQRLQVTQLCINTAIVYMHRFYMLQSFTKFSRNSIAAAALFLAAKVEEQPRKLEHVIKVAHMCLGKEAGPLDTKSEAYLEQAQELVVNENILLQSLGFDITVDHPHTHVVRSCQLVRASKDLAQTSYFLATNSLHLTTMCLQYRPTIVACVCIHLACKWSNWEIPRSSEGKEWFWYNDKECTTELLEELTQDFLNILDKCPSKLKKKIMTWKSGKDRDELQYEPGKKKDKFDDLSSTITSSAASAASSASKTMQPPSAAPTSNAIPHAAGAPPEGKEHIKDRQNPLAKPSTLLSHPARPEHPQPAKPYSQALAGSVEANLRRVKTEPNLISITPKEYLERKEKERQAIMHAQGHGRPAPPGDHRPQPVTDHRSKRHHLDALSQSHERHRGDSHHSHAEQRAREAHRTSGDHRKEALKGHAAEMHHRSDVHRSRGEAAHAKGHGEHRDSVRGAAGHWREVAHRSRGDPAARPDPHPSTESSQNKLHHRSFRDAFLQPHHERIPGEHSRGTDPHAESSRSRHPGKSQGDVPQLHEAPKLPGDITAAILQNLEPEDSKIHTEIDVVTVDTKDSDLLRAKQFFPEKTETVSSLPTAAETLSALKSESQSVQSIEPEVNKTIHQRSSDKQKGTPDSKKLTISLSQLRDRYQAAKETVAERKATDTPERGQHPAVAGLSETQASSSPASTQSPSKLKIKLKTPRQGSTVVEPLVLPPEKKDLKLKIDLRGSPGSASIKREESHRHTGSPSGGELKLKLDLKARRIQELTGQESQPRSAPVVPTGQEDSAQSEYRLHNQGSNPLKLVLSRDKRSSSSAESQGGHRSRHSRSHHHGHHSKTNGGVERSHSSRKRQHSPHASSTSSSSAHGGHVPPNKMTRHSSRSQLSSAAVDPVPRPTNNRWEVDATHAVPGGLGANGNSQTGSPVVATPKKKKVPTATLR